ncbi:murein biosynthesis integral membrane protein MurJ [Kitasatospora sp. LaBMicrA B282]|uniref:murein biosynthesis integral membrane protein MurJ n=1 Tax=Kitasatospora sp. LaBMicrA B282 TaxID=3420949 RepID=UPI003D12FDBF
MTTHTAGEPYGSYGPPESYGSAQPYPAAPTQGQPGPDGYQEAGQQNVGRPDAGQQGSPQPGMTQQGYGTAEGYPQGYASYGQPEGYPDPSGYPQNPYQQDPYQQPGHPQGDYGQPGYPQQGYEQPAYPQQQPGYGSPEGYPDPGGYQQNPYQQDPYQQQAYGTAEGYPQQVQLPGQQGAEQQYYAGHYREPQQYADQYAVSEPYQLPADYGMPHLFNDPPTMSLSLRSIQNYNPTAPASAPVPQQREATEAEQPSEVSEQATANRNGLIMAIGTLGSRALGFVRSAVIAFAIGVGQVAGPYNIGNTVPNVVFTMLIGGALSSVFVPELVKAAKTHKDGGVAYTDRLLTLCGVALLALTVVAVAAAPAIVSVYAPDYTGAQRDLTITFARYCLPEIFFYGVFTLLGQVLNARGKFGAMMWTPALNNIVVIAVFGMYIAIGGNATSAGQVTAQQSMLLGVGTTLGVVIQAAGMLPSLKAAKFRFRPRFDWRGSGLGTPLRSASWALLLVIVTQVAYTEITALTTMADALGHKAHLDGVGNASYSNAYQLFVVPQGVITISMVTAIVPQMAKAATEGNLPKIGQDLATVLRNSAAMVIPATVLFIAFAAQISGLAYGYGHAARSGIGLTVISETLLAFAIGIPFFCAQYALARGFYAMGDARTPFWLTVVSSGTNVLLSFLAYATLGARWIVVGMAVAQTVACIVNMVITGRVLARRLRSLPTAPEDAEARARVMKAALSGPVRSGLDGRRVFGLHLGLVLACLPGALVGHFLANGIGSMLGGGFLGNVFGLGVGSVFVLASLFVLAKPFGATAAVAPLARKLRLPFPQPAPEPAGRRRRA